MKRRVYIICQKRDWDKGKPQALSEDSQLSYVYPSDGLNAAKSKMEEMNKDKSMNPVHIRIATIEIGKELSQSKSNAHKEGEE